ncbi:MAG: glycosyltransferase family 2 protein [Patescibacteria group bacterium]|nr:glycosyltransferase family 2 protein [Patescibacteria group bacterium]MDE2172625.1 glycosyltransferase family 2 protein [Patescibacteria group bacterium]
MKISIIIPAYNEELRLAAAIRAALSQEYPSFEVIVVDNASTDKTFDIACSFIPRVQVVREVVKGTSAARECGRQAATGEILAYMDADCLPDKDWLSKGVALFKTSDVVAASGPYDYYDASPVFNAASMFIERYVFSAVNMALRPFRLGTSMMGGNSFFRAASLGAIGGFNVAITFYGDETDVAKRLAKIGTIAYSPRLTVKTSARRFRAEGTLVIFGKYVSAFFMGICTR